MSANTISQRGLDLIKGFESCRLTSYQDSKGVWTIGWGHTGGVYQNQTITQEQADAYLAKDAEDGEYGININVKVDLNQNQFDALCSLVFNIGYENFRTSTLLKLLNAGDYTGAQAEFVRWHYAGKVALPGLLKRRLAEAALFGEPVSAAETSAQTTVPPAVAPTPPPNHVVQTTTGKLQLTAIATGGAAAVIQGVQQAQPVINAAQNAVSLTAGLPQWLRLLSVACVVGCIACAAFTLYHKHKDFKPENKT